MKALHGSISSFAIGRLAPWIPRLGGRAFALISSFSVPFLFVLATFCVTPALYAEEAPKAVPPAIAAAYEARTFTAPDGGTLGYRLLRPEKYDAAKKYPLVLVLHGSGERGRDNEAQLKYGAELFLKPQARATFACFVVVPQCPPDQKWADVDWSSDTPVQPEKVSEPMSQVLGVLDGLETEFSIDQDRLYVTGLSMGGYGTWDLITRYPAKWAAAAPICGGGDKTRAAHAKDVPIWAFHGAMDKTVKPARTEEMIAAIEAAGGHPLFSEYPYVGHGSWTLAFDEPEFLPWMFAQKRGAAPVAFETVAGPFAQPPSNQCPGAGPMQSGIWFRGLWRSRREQWAKSKEGEQGAVVFFGDSITQQWGSLANDFSKLKTANRGISGDTTRGLRTRLQGDVLVLHPKAVSILIGTNDLDQGGAPEAVAENLKVIVADMHKANPDMPIIINKVMPRGPKPGFFPEKIKILNGLYEDAFKNDSKVTFCDTWTLFDDGNGSCKKEEFPDLLHPNAAGYGKWTTELMPIFAKLGLE
jgi:lysophospholipase L1-like esterase/poly(3-hydroxybutyrate) depolymerase